MNVDGRHFAAWDDKWDVGDNRLGLLIDPNTSSLVLSLNGVVGPRMHCLAWGVAIALSDEDYRSAERMVEEIICPLQVPWDLANPELRLRPSTEFCNGCHRCIDAEGDTEPVV